MTCQLTQKGEGGIWDVRFFLLALSVVTVQVHGLIFRCFLFLFSGEEIYSKKLIITALQILKETVRITEWDQLQKVQN